MADNEKVQNDPRWQETLLALWEYQQQWSSAADQLKANDRSTRGPLVAIGFAGVVLSTVSPQLVASLSTSGAAPDVHNRLQLAAAIAGPGIVAICAVLTRELLGPKREKAWPRARTVAEALKAQGYLYAAGTPPYPDRDKAPALLTKAINELTTGDPLLDIPLEPVTKLNGRHPTARLTIQEYIDRRAKKQRDHYLTGAVENRAKLRTWRWISLTLAVAATGLGVIAGVTKSGATNVWIAVLTTATATLTSFLFVSQYEFLAASYLETSQKLKLRLTQWDAETIKNEVEAQRLILDCESIIASQNHSWARELSVRDDKVLADHDKQLKAASPS
jgi:hypothetical protein